jgi:hypothetical protein
VSRRTQWIIGAALAGMAAIVICWVAWWRVDEAAAMSKPHSVHTYGGTNYVVRLKELTVGRGDTGYAVLVSVELENPNAFPVVLNRDWFILVDANKDYYLPSTTGTQTQFITLTANGKVDSDLLSFVVPEEGLAGTMGMRIGQDYWIMLKDQKPFDRKLKSGEFVTFRRRDW